MKLLQFLIGVAIGYGAMFLYDKYSPKFHRFVKTRFRNSGDTV